MNALQFEFFEDQVSMLGGAGFPAASMEHLISDLDLNAELAPRPSATYFARVDGHSMQEMDIHTGDVLVIDRSLRPVNGSITVCYVDGEFTLKKMSVSDGCVYLIPANKGLRPIKVTEGENFIVWGVVTYVIKKMS